MVVRTWQSVYAMVRGVIEVMRAKLALFGRVADFVLSCLMDDGDVKMTLPALQRFCALDKCAKNNLKTRRTLIPRIP